MEFSERLRHLRERQGLSQNGLAKASGVAQAVIQRLEAGVRDIDNLSVGVARRLARALQVSVDHLIGMYENGDGASDPEPAGTALVGAADHAGSTESFADNGAHSMADVGKE